MNSVIIKNETTTIKHKKNAASKTPEVSVPIFRGMDLKTFKYILQNRYYPDTLISLIGLDYIQPQRTIRKNEWLAKVNPSKKINDLVANA
jgi:hypothetical protein